MTQSHTAEVKFEERLAELAEERQKKQEQREAKEARCQCYKTFYGRKLRLFVLSYSVCPWQAFPAKPNVCGWGLEPTLEGST